MIVADFRVTINYSTAYYWYKKSSDQGNASAPRNIGILYENGEGVTKDYGTALEWYNLAKERGYGQIDEDIERVKKKLNIAHSELAERVKAIIADKLRVEEYEVTMEASLRYDLEADSLDAVELIMEFEKEFNISIPDEDAERITTVGDAIAYIVDHVN